MHVQELWAARMKTLDEPAFEEAGGSVWAPLLSKSGSGAERKQGSRSKSAQGPNFFSCCAFLVVSFQQNQQNRPVRLTMASDEIVWDIINNQFCSYKIKYVPVQCWSYRRNTNYFFTRTEQRRNSLFAAMNTTSLATARSSIVHLPTRNTPQSAVILRLDASTST